MNITTIDLHKLPAGVSINLGQTSSGTSAVGGINFADTQHLGENNMYPYDNTPVPTYFIHYTSTNGEIVEPSSAATWGSGVTLLTNTYEENEGVLGFDAEPTTIGANAFSGCTTLESVNIPSSVTSIGNGSFSGCTALESVTIPSGVTSIGNSAFSGCTSLEEVNIPSGVITIAGTTFAGCTSLEEVNIPSGVTAIGNGAFSGCTGLSAITVNSSVPPTVYSVSFRGVSATGVLHVTVPLADYSSWIGTYLPIGWVIDAPVTSTMTYTSTNGQVVTPYAESFGSGVSIYSNTYSNNQGTIVFLGVPTAIGNDVFSGCTTLESIDIPSSVTLIGATAFEGCTSLEEVNIPSGVTGIGSSAFKDCTSLSAVTIGSGVDYISSMAFMGCTALESVTIPDNVTDTSDDLFYGCTSLSSVTIGSGLTSLYHGMFAGCTSLEEVNIPSGITDIGYSTFAGCSGLSSITVNSAVPPTVLSGAFDNVASVGVLHVTAVGADYSSWIGTYLPIGWTIDAPVIVSMNYTSTNGQIVSPNNGVSFGSGVTVYSNTYSNNQGTIVFLGTPTEIGASAFSGCSTLQSINFISSITSIGAGAFSGCTGLSAITLPDTIESIDTGAFRGCTGLTTVSIGSGFGVIPDYCFYNCTSLSSITIPETIINIGEHAFEGCTSLSGVVFDYEVPIDDDGGDDSGDDGGDDGGDELYCPNCGEPFDGENCGNCGYSIYDDGGDEPDPDEPEEPEEPEPDPEEEGGEDEPEDVDEPMFMMSRSMPMMRALGDEPEGTIYLNNLGAYAFAGCTSLPSINIPSSVEYIGDHVFAGCTALTSVDFNYFEIPAYACAGCTSLTGLGIDNQLVEAISAYAFSGCTSLTSLTIYNNILTIDTGAFVGCSGLTSVIIDSENVAAENSGNNAAPKFGNQVTSYTFGDSCYTIGENWMSGATGVHSIEIGENVYEISGSAFYGCSNISSITVNPTTAPTLNTHCFSGLPATGTLHVTSYGGDYSSWISTASTSDTQLASGWNIEIAYGVLNYTSSDGNIIEPDGGSFGWGTDVEIVDNIYENNQGTIIFNNKPTLVPPDAFSGQTRLTSIEIPDSVIVVGDTFDGCTSLSAVTVGTDVARFTSSSLTFNYCPLRNVTINSDHIASNTGYTTSANLSHLFGGGVTNYTLGGNVQSISERAFYGASAITGLTFGNSVQEIGQWAFENCTGLSSVTIPDSVVELHGAAFQGCSNLASVSLGSGLTAIDWYTFSACTSLSSITLPQSLTHLGEYSFVGCTSLPSINIPSGVTEIGHHAFSGCTALSSVTVEGTTPPTLADTSFDYTHVWNNVTLHTPTGLKHYYHLHPYWQYFDVVDDNTDVSGNTEYGVLLPPHSYIQTNVDVNSTFRASVKCAQCSKTTDVNHHNLMGAGNTAATNNHIFIELLRPATLPPAVTGNSGTTILSYYPYNTGKSEKASDFAFSGVSSSNWPKYINNYCFECELGRSSTTIVTSYKVSIWNNALKNPRNNYTITNVTASIGKWMIGKNPTNSSYSNYGPMYINFFAYRTPYSATTNTYRFFPETVSGITYLSDTTKGRLSASKLDTTATKRMYLCDGKVYYLSDGTDMSGITGKYGWNDQYVDSVTYDNSNNFGWSTFNGPVVSNYKMCRAPLMLSGITLGSGFTAFEIPASVMELDNFSVHSSLEVLVIPAGVWRMTNSLNNITSDTYVYYNGPTAEWAEIEKSNCLSNFTGGVIHCVDGTVTI